MYEGTWKLANLSNVSWQGGARTYLPFHSLVPVGRIHHAYRGYCYWMAGFDPAFERVALHDASAPRNHHASRGGLRAAILPEKETELRHLAGCRWLPGRLLVLVPVHVPGYQNHDHERHPASAHATSQRDCASPYPANDRRVPKTRPR